MSEQNNDHRVVITGDYMHFYAARDILFPVVGMIQVLAVAVE